MPPSSLSPPSAALTKLLSRLPIPRAVANRLYPMLVSDPAIAVPMFDGSTLISDIRFYMTREVLATGLYEPTLTRVFGTLVKSGDVVFDVGANVGYFTVLAARLAGPSGRVFAFEPLSINTAFIRASITASNLKNVEIVEVFCGKEDDASISMSVPTPDNLGTGSYVDTAPVSEHRSVPTITLNHFCDRHNLTKVDFLKMDIEGAEAVAIPGMIESLDTHRFTLLAVEFHGKHLKQIGEDALALKRIFTSRGYRGFEIVPPDKLIDRTDTTLEGSFMVFAAPGTSIYSQQTVDLLPLSAFKNCCPAV